MSLVGLIHRNYWHLHSFINLKIFKTKDQQHYSGKFCWIKLIDWFLWTIILHKHEATDFIKVDSTVLLLSTRTIGVLREKECSLCLEQHLCTLVIESIATKAWRITTLQVFHHGMDAFSIKWLTRSLNSHMAMATSHWMCWLSPDLRS